MLLETPVKIETRTDPVESWKRIRSLLKSKWDRVQEQIRQYPTPIPACDADFNAFLQEREQLSEELGRLDRAMERAAPDDAASAIDEFLRTSRFFTDAEKRQITA